MSFYNGNVPRQYSMTVKFEVNSGISQIQRNIGSYISAWDSAAAVNTGRFRLTQNQTTTGGSATALFIWANNPFVLTLTFPPATTGGTPTTQTINVNSAFFVDTPLNGWSVQNTSATVTVDFEVTYATADLNSVPVL